MATRRELMLLVDEVLARLQAGETLDTCLADFPAEADELRPLVETAYTLRRTAPAPAPDPTKRAAARARFLAAAAQMSEASTAAATPETLMGVVDQVVARVRAGESLDACLAEYPAEAAELRPLVETALSLRQTPPAPAPDPSKSAAARARFLAAAAQLSETAAIATPETLMGVVDQVVARVRAGESLDACLAEHPAEAAELRPLIETALSLRQTPAAPPPDPTKRAAARARFLAAAAQMSETATAATPSTVAETTPLRGMAASGILMTLVDKVISRVRAGESLDACLADYPAEAAHLRPLVETALNLGELASAPPPDPVKQAETRVVVLTEAAKLEAAAPATAKARGSQLAWPQLPTQAIAAWWAMVRASLVAFLHNAGNMGGMQRLAMTAAAALLFFVAGTTSVVRVSAASLPGDTLYTVKEVTRAVQLALTLDPTVREQVAIAQEQARQEEVIQVVQVKADRIRNEPIPSPAITDVVSEVDGSGLVRVGQVLVRLAPGMAVEVGSRIRVLGTIGVDGIINVTQVAVLARPQTQQVRNPNPTATTASVALEVAASATPIPPTATPRPSETRPAAESVDAVRVRPTNTATALAPTASVTVAPRPSSTATVRPIVLPSATVQQGPVVEPTAEATNTPEPTATRVPEAPQAARTPNNQNQIAIDGTFIKSSGARPNEVWTIAHVTRGFVDVQLSGRTSRQGAEPRQGDRILVRGAEENPTLIRASQVTVVQSTGSITQPGTPLPSFSVQGVALSRLPRSDREAVWTIRTDSAPSMTLVETAETEVTGMPSNGNVAGRNVTVVYRKLGETLFALKISLQPDERELIGVISRITATEWTVGGIRIIITAATQIEGPAPQVFDTARVYGSYQEDRSFLARRIIVLPRQRPPTETPTPTAPPVTPTATATRVVPTVTVSPTAIPPTITPAPPTVTPDPPTVTVTPGTSTEVTRTATALPPGVTPTRTPSPQATATRNK